MSQWRERCSRGVRNKKRPQKVFLKWSGRRDSNSRQSAWKADTLPTELRPLNVLFNFQRLCSVGRVNIMDTLHFVSLGQLSYVRVTKQIYLKHKTFSRVYLQIPCNSDIAVGTLSFAHLTGFGE